MSEHSHPHRNLTSFRLHTAQLNLADDLRAREAWPKSTGRTTHRDFQFERVCEGRGLPSYGPPTRDSQLRCKAEMTEAAGRRVGRDRSYNSRVMVGIGIGQGCRRGGTLGWRHENGGIQFIGGSAGPDRGRVCGDKRIWRTCFWLRSHGRTWSTDDNGRTQTASRLRYYSAPLTDRPAILRRGIYRFAT